MPVVSADEQARTIDAMKPVRAGRPLVAVIGANEGSETTDYIIPYGVLKRSGVADVVALGVTDAPVTLMPSLTIQPDASLAAFDLTHPQGADYVFVPAFHERKNPAAISWLREQARKGAMIIGICEGALVVAEAGLLKGKHATTHWFATGTLTSIDPSITYVPNRRYVVDGRVVTTTGVSASLPVSLAVVAAIGGREVAERVAAEIGVVRWDVAHDSARFRLTRSFARTVLSNAPAIWRHKRVGIEIANGVDEISLALVADAWSRTFSASAYAVSGAPVISQNGLRIVSERAGGVFTPVALAPGAAMHSFDAALQAIAKSFDADTANMVRVQLELDVR
jgi:putative intracellular protease/amidase